jgi:hypothetical protein
MKLDPTPEGELKLLPLGGTVESLEDPPKVQLESLWGAGEFLALLALKLANVDGIMSSSSKKLSPHGGQNESEVMPSLFLLSCLKLKLVLFL